MKMLLIISIGIHALIHFLGFVKAFRFADIAILQRTLSKTDGVLWLCAAILFFISLTLFLVELSLWWTCAAAAILISQFTVLHRRFGTA